MKNPLKGWQPISAAAKRIGVSRQWLSTMAKNGDIPNLLINGDYWVRDGLAYKPDRIRQKKAKDSA